MGRNIKEVKKLKAQVTVTPNEAKRLIAKGIVQLPEVQAALKNGKIIIKSGTSPSAVAEELIGQPMGISGRVSPSGTMGAQDRTKGIYRVLINRGEVTTYAPNVTEILSEADVAAQIAFFPQMGKGDVVITGANAIDPQKRAGLWVGGATLSPGHLLPAFRVQGVTIIIAVGWEKLIPTSIEEAAATAGRFSMDLSMGMPVGLIPINGKVVTETDAISILTDVKATVIGSGGIQGAEGSTTFVLDGDPADIKKAWEIIWAVKGASLGGQVETLVECEKRGEICKGYILKDGEKVPKHPSCVYREEDFIKKVFS
jgi:hypothetical protein